MKKLKVPSWMTIALSVVAGALAVLNQSALSYGPTWKGYVTGALALLSAMGIGPLFGSRLRNVLHVTPQVTLVFATVLSASTVAVSALPEGGTVKTVAVGVLTVLSGLLLGPKVATV